MAEDGNVQDMAVDDKNFPSLGATEEAQDVSRLNKVIIPMASFTNPNNPLTAGGSVNLELDSHPVEHAPEYGQTALDSAGVERDVHYSAMDTHSLEMRDAVETPGRPGRREAAARGAQATLDFPDDRGTWQKKHWQGKAREYGLNVGGNMDEVQSRVEEYEGQVEEVSQWNAEDWKGAVEEAETAEDLAGLRGLYDRSGASYSTVESAFDAKQNDLNES